MSVREICCPLRAAHKSFYRKTIVFVDKKTLAARWPSWWYSARHGQILLVAWLTATAQIALVALLENSEMTLHDVLRRKWAIKLRTS